MRLFGLILSFLTLCGQHRGAYTRRRPHLTLTLPVGKRRRDRRRDPELAIRADVLAAIRATVGAMAPEQGGMLGGDRATGHVTRFYFDRSAARTGGTYSPDHATVNRVLKEEWGPEGVQFMGFVHSHPGGLGRPSEGDRVYARRILAAMPSLQRLLLPIITFTGPKGRMEFHPWCAVRDGGEVRVEQLPLVELSAAQEPRPVPVAAPRVSATPVPVQIGAPAAATTEADMRETFRRVRDAYDLPRLARCRLVVAGAGGAAGWVEAMARAGVGEFVLLDGDTVGLTNLATQQVYRRDLGRPKVDCIAERIRDINPAARVRPLARMLDDDLDDGTFAAEALAPFPGHEAPEVTLLCGLTDSFPAQARVNRLALHFGLPSLCAQVYREGRGAEVSFTYPGVTRACHRCILSSRYRAYLDEGFANDVVSDGTPIFATDRLNALKGFVALALLHHGMEPGTSAALHGGDNCGKPSFARWGTLLDRIAGRNLAFVRMDPDLGATLGLTAFDRIIGDLGDGQLIFDDVLWRPQAEESPATGYAHACPDCGGTGDLRDAKGTFADTRAMHLTRKEA